MDDRSCARPKRPTEYAEQDVYLTENRYNESDKEIKKAKPLKHFELSELSIVNEVYNFSEELSPLKVPSPQLFSKEVLEEVLPSRLQNLYQLGPSTSSTQPATPTSSVAAGGKLSSQGSSTGGAAGGGGGTVLNIPQHLLQKLLASASQISTTRPVVIPLQQPALNALAGSSALATPTSSLIGATPVAITTAMATSLSSLATTSVTPSQTKSVSSTTPGQKSSAAVAGGSSSSGGYKCTWDGCGKVFPNVSDFGSHLLSNIPGVGHISKDADGNSYCRWSGCPRNPSNDGRPFDTTANLMRHLREVHLMKMSHSVLGIPVRGERSSSSSTATMTTIAAAPPRYSVAPPTTQSSSTSLLQATPSTSQTGPMVTAVEKPKQIEEIAPIMRPPSVNRRQAVHSDIYKKYIKGLESDSQYMSTLKNSREIRQSHQLALSRVHPTDWIDAQALKDKKDSASLVDALWALRDQLLQDSLNSYSDHH